MLNLAQSTWKNVLGVVESPGILLLANYWELCLRLSNRIGMDLFFCFGRILVGVTCYILCYIVILSFYRVFHCLWTKAYLNGDLLVRNEVENITSTFLDYIQQQ